MAKPVMGTETDVVGSRVFAFIVDQILSAIVAVVVMLVVGGILGGLLFGVSEGATLVGLLFGYFVGFVAYVCYYILLEGMYGQTPGKMLGGVIVVKEDGSPCTIEAAFVRNFLRIIDGFFGYVVGLVVMLMSDRNQRIGDSVAKTVVTRAE